jgi:hypothetical protein
VIEYQYITNIEVDVQKNKLTANTHQIPIVLTATAIPLDSKRQAPAKK